MKTTSTRYTGLFVSRRHLLFVPVILIALAILATVSFLPTASASNPFGKVFAPPAAKVGPAAAPKANSLFATRAGERSPFAFLLPSLAETIETFADDCSTPKTAFSLGETVCAKTDGVDLMDTRFVNWILLGSPNTVVYGGEGITDITTNPQTFTFIPTDQGSYKVSIAIPGDISQTPAGFTVGPPASTVISTYAADCTTPKISFSLGETVCAKVNGEPLGASDPIRRINWQARSGLIVHSTDITTDPQTDTFALPANATTMIGGLVVDNRGTWRITSNATEDASIRQQTYISVHDPAAVVADLWIEQATNTANAEVEAGSSTTLDLFVSNRGPDAAQNVVVTDTIPTNTTFVSIVESSGLGFNCDTPTGGVVTCTLPSLPPGSLAKFTLALQVNAGTGAGTVIANSASVTSATTDLDAADNSSDGSAVVPTPPPAQTCTITCHENISVVANTVQGGDPGAIVNFGAGAGVGSCGAIIATFEGLPEGQAASGSFFPVGTTVINVSSETGGGSCSFTITVVQATPPTISCPPNKIVSVSGSDTSANVDPGVPTTDPSTGVTVTGVRSDEIMCGCDPEPCTCPSVPLTDPYPIGVTTITWTVTDSNGLSSSCVQSITVNSTGCGVGDDTTPPTITAPPDVSVNTGAGSTTCGVALSPSDNELGTPDVDDNCPGNVTVSSNIPPGNLFPVGTTTVTYTARDGAGNTATDTQVVTVVDNTPPVIVAPADASYVCPSEVPAASPSQAHGDDPNLPNGGPVFDNCGSPVVTVSETSSGSGNVASPKIITRTFTALDSHGNSASSVQHITVIDPTPPTFTFVPPAVTAFTGPGATVCSTVVSDATLGTATATDNCTVTVTRSGVPAGNIFPKGNTTVTYTATDSGGNTATATQTVTVIDNTPPTISCQANIIADFDPAVNGAVVTYTAPVGTDNCPGASTAQTGGLASGATFPLGTTTNTFTVTDGVGLTATCSFKVTVALTSIVGLDSVSITGNGLVDSYDSVGGYPATKGSLANVLSNGTITISGSSKVFGNVRSTRVGVNLTGTSQVSGNVTAGTTVSKAASAVIGGTITNNALAPVMTLPAVPACGPPYSPNSGISGTYSYNASTGNLNLSGNNIATLANGTYCFNNVTLTNSAQLKVNGPVVIKLTGALSTGGASALPNTTLIPKNLQILSSYSGSNGVALGNSSTLQLVIYAPNTNVNITGSAPLFGTVSGKTITLSNSGMIHYDTTLKTIWPDVWTLIFGP
jgi:uncharacterized repeat protein (TIGR01451 family)